MVSHELKTPLTSLTAIIQVLSKKFKSKEDNFISNSLDRANVQVKKMGTMINGFLNLSRLESGKMVMDKVSFNIEELVADTIAEMQITAPAHQIKLHPCESFKVFADRDKIGSVISNLISNAIKYSPKGKVITVDCKRVDNMVSISITDEGIGIAEHDLQSLFDRYYRVNNPMQKHISGFGIGLYLSAEIIRSHEGEIDVSSELGKGSTFYFKLPITA